MKTAKMAHQIGPGGPVPEWNTKQNSRGHEADVNFLSSHLSPTKKKLSLPAKIFPGKAQANPENIEIY